MAQLGGQGQQVLILPEGTNRFLGRDAQRMNILAGKVLAETVRTTLGPKGMDKMLVDSLGDIVDNIRLMDEKWENNLKSLDFDEKHKLKELLTTLALEALDDMKTIRE